MPMGFHTHFWTKLPIPMTIFNNCIIFSNVEYYDIKLNEWKMVSPMPWKGVTVKCAAVGSVVYVLAGFQGVGRLGHILEYNTETDKWIANSKVRAFPVTSCLICVVDTCGANEETLET